MSNHMMKAQVMHQYKQLTLEEIPQPNIESPHDIKVKILAAAICGSDVHGFDGSTGRRIPPVVMGHEGAGEVVEVGSAVQSFAPGDLITFDSTIYCRECGPCSRGEVNLCDNRKVLGVSCDEYNCNGIFAEYVVIPDYIAYHLPKSVSPVQAALTEPAAVAAHAIRITPMNLDETAVVIGTGVIGLLVIKILKASSCGMLIAMDTDPEKRKVALQCGADIALDPLNPHWLTDLSKATDGKMADHAFEAVGASSSIATAVDSVRKGGTVTLIGNVSPTVNFPLQKVVSRQLQVFGSCAIAGEYPLVIDMMARGKLDVSDLISEVRPLADAQECFERLYAKEAGLLKIVLQP